MVLDQPMVLVKISAEGDSIGRHQPVEAGVRHCADCNLSPVI